MTTKPIHENILTGRSAVKCKWIRTDLLHTTDLACHRESEFHYIKHGEGFYFIQNRKYAFSKNHILAIKPMEIHKLIMQSPNIEKGSLYFPLSLLKDNKQLKEILKKCQHITVLTEKEAILIEVIFKNIKEETDNAKPLWEDIVYSQITQFLLIMKRASRRNNQRIIKNTLVENLIEYIEKNFTRDISLLEIAQTFSFSISRISHIFKEETGMGIKHYVLQRRIVQAKKLLEETSGLKVTAVSKKLGFSDFALFNRKFKKITGLTSSNYRRVSRQGVK